jgi:hypothetical protein
MTHPPIEGAASYRTSGHPPIKAAASYRTSGHPPARTLMAYQGGQSSRFAISRDTGGAGRMDDRLPSQYDYSPPDDDDDTEQRQAHPHDFEGARTAEYRPRQTTLAHA